MLSRGCLIDKDRPWITIQGDAATKDFMLTRTTKICTLATTLMISISAGALPATAAPQPATISAVAVSDSGFNDPFTHKVVDLINAERAKVKAPPVVWNQSIGNVSQDWANKLGVATKDPDYDMAKLHRPDAGGSLIPKGATWYREIIAFNYTPEAVVQWWMGSAGHKAALLDPKATDIGVGYVVPASGPYAGWHMVVSNLAGYPVSGAATPAPTTPSVPATTPPVIPANRLNAVDTKGNLWAYKTGLSTLSSRVNNGTGWLGLKQLVAVDWNSDGELDLVARWGNGYLTYYQGIGDGDYKAPVNIGAGWQAYDITATKFKNTDKYPGLIARNTTDGKLYYYPNASGYKLSARTLIGNGGWVPMTELNAVDWDRDGKMDVIARNSAGELRLYRSNGAGAFVNETRKIIGAGWQGFDSISAEPDFDGKGSKGVLARRTNGSLLYYPIVNGRWGTSKIVGSSGWSGYIIAAGVVDK